MGIKLIKINNKKRNNKMCFFFKNNLFNKINVINLNIYKYEYYRFFKNL